MWYVIMRHVYYASKFSSKQYNKLKTTNRSIILRDVFMVYGQFIASFLGNKNLQCNQCDIIEVLKC